MQRNLELTREILEVMVDNGQPGLEESSVRRMVQPKDPQSKELTYHISMLLLEGCLVGHNEHWPIDTKKKLGVTWRGHNLLNELRDQHIKRLDYDHYEDADLGRPDDGLFVQVYQKQPITVEAIRYTDDIALSDLQHWTGDGGDHIKERHSPVQIVVNTLEGQMALNRGDWLIRGVKGEYYPCRDDVFRETYVPTHLHHHYRDGEQVGGLRGRLYHEG